MNYDTLVIPLYRKNEGTAPPDLRQFTAAAEIAIDNHEPVQVLGQYTYKGDI
jgi:hypothetical protein